MFTSLCLNTMGLYTISTWGLQKLLSYEFLFFFSLHVKMKNLHFWCCQTGMLAHYYTVFPYITLAYCSNLCTIRVIILRQQTTSSPVCLTTQVKKARYISVIVITSFNPSETIAGGDTGSHVTCNSMENTCLAPPTPCLWQQFPYACCSHLSKESSSVYTTEMRHKPHKVQFICYHTQARRL